MAFSSDIKKLSIGSRTSATRRNEPEIDTRETTTAASGIVDGIVGGRERDRAGGTSLVPWMDEGKTGTTRYPDGQQCHILGDMQQAR